MINTDGIKTEDVLDIARDVFVEKKLKDVVIASTRGNTGLASAERFKDLEANLIIVAHSVGFKEPNNQEFDPEARTEIEKLGSSVLFSTMPFHTVNDAVRGKMGSSIETLIADALRMMGQGTKVCVEIVAMACDAGLIESGRNILAVAGTGRGADTVLIIKSANSKRLFDLKIIDVIAKPQAL